MNCFKDYNIFSNSILNLTLIHTKFAFSNNKGEWLFHVWLGKTVKVI